MIIALAVAVAATRREVKPFAQTTVNPDIFRWTPCQQIPKLQDDLPEMGEILAVEGKRETSLPQLREEDQLPVIVVRTFTKSRNFACSCQLDLASHTWINFFKGVQFLI